MFTFFNGAHQSFTGFRAELDTRKPGNVLILNTDGVDKATGLPREYKAFSATPAEWSALVAAVNAALHAPAPVAPAPAPVAKVTKAAAPAVKPAAPAPDALSALNERVDALASAMLTVVESLNATKTARKAGAK